MARATILASLLLGLAAARPGLAQEGDAPAPLRACRESVT
jgi:hypothetical protein